MTTLPLKRIALDDMKVYTDPRANPDGHTLGPVDGITLYSDRALALAYDAVYVDGARGVDAVRSYLEYLRERGLGAQGVRFVRGPTLFQGVLADPHGERARLARELADGGTTIEAFTGASPDWQEFLAELRVPDDSIRTADWAVAQELDDKEGLRVLGRKMGLRAAFPTHVFAGSRRSALAKIALMRLLHRQLIIKRPDLESGVGTEQVNGPASWVRIPRFLKTYGGGARRLIVEEWVEADETTIASLQWYVPRQGPAQKRFMSQQFCKGTSHDGNFIAASDHDCFPLHWPESMRRAIAAQAWKLTEPFVSYAQDRRSVGPHGFDFIVAVKGNRFRVYLLEANIRKTAATYLENLRWQCQKTGRLNQACAAMRNCHPVSATYHWRHVVSALENTRYRDGLGDIALKPEGGGGVIVLNPRCLSLDPPKCQLVALDEDGKRVQRLVNAAVDRLEGRTSLRA